MSEFELSPAAVNDMDEIWLYIAEDNIEAADELVDRLENAMRELARMPGMGHSRDDLADETLSVWPVGSYLVIYRPHHKPLQIVRVVSGFRDLTAITL